MPVITLNNVSFSDGPAAMLANLASSRRAPQKVTLKTTKAGRSLETRRGRLVVVRTSNSAGGMIRSWTLEWQKVNAATKAAVEAIFALETTFLFGFDGGGWIVLCDRDALDVEPADDTMVNGTHFYNVRLTIREDVS